MSWFSSLIGGVSNFFGLSDIAKTAGGLIADSQSPQYDQQNKFQKDYFDYTFNRQAARQDSLNANQALVGKNSMLNAGLNPSMSASGYSPNVTPTTGNAGSVSNGPSVLDAFSSVLGIATSLSQMKKNNAEIENIDADTEFKKIRNKRETSYDNWLLENNNLVFIDPVTKEKISFFGNFSNKGDMSAYIDTLNKIPQALASVKQSETNMTQAELQRKVANLQIKNDPVIEALVGMPLKQYQELQEEIKDLTGKNNHNYWSFETQNKAANTKFTNTQEEMVQWQKTLSQSESFVGFVKAIKDPNLDFTDKLAMGFAYAMSLFARFR